MKKNIQFIYITFAFLLACGTTSNRVLYDRANKLLHETKNITTKPYLKAHLKNGDICILTDTWQIDTIKNQLAGMGKRFNFNRNQIFEGLNIIPIDSVSIFETNTKVSNGDNGRIAALSILAGLDISMSIYCGIRPKACFGSCPTFYLNEADNFHYADAEGFSDAISPSMEYSDIDALNFTNIKDQKISLVMKNEALETHCVNEVKLFAYPKNKNEHIFQTGDNLFYQCDHIYTLSKATASEGNITALLKEKDRVERYSYTDSNNLLKKEEIIIDFENIKNKTDLGLVIHFRQTLLTTYLFYSAMGYMGNEVSDVFAQLENNTLAKNRFDKLGNAIGGIDVFVFEEKSKTWKKQGTVKETGPIAINKQILPLINQTNSTSLKVKLVLNQGSWRIDYIGLTQIKGRVQSIEILPSSILNKGIENATLLEKIKQPEQYIISMPGDIYTFNFELPTTGDYELFLYTKGYYLEWMREHWIKDKDLAKLKQLLIYPKKFLKNEAATYKVYEKYMEQEFWNSKIDSRNFSYHEK